MDGTFAGAGLTVSRAPGVDGTFMGAGVLGSGAAAAAGTFMGAGVGGELEARTCATGAFSGTGKRPLSRALTLASATSTRPVATSWARLSSMSCMPSSRPSTMVEAI